MIGSTLELRGVRVPAALYGTAWKEQDTRRLVLLALRAGFRGIDTANQRKHYFEAAVGEALREAALPRGELFLQSKFTHARSQDERLPYDPRAPVEAQVRQSFESSLEHLGVDALDSLVLHGPTHTEGLSVEDLGAWSAMEALQREGRVRLLGVSNVSATQLELLCARSAAPPSFVQNRCYARRGWDRAVRGVCARRGVVYQGFSLLTANRAELASAALRGVASKRGLTPEQLVFRFAAQLGMVPLTGSSSEEHLRQDLAALGAEPLEEAERALLEGLSG